MLFAFSNRSFRLTAKKANKITELIIAFFRGRLHSQSIFVCALKRLPYLISNMKQREASTEITGSILMINGLLHFFFLQKSYFAYKTTRNQLVCQRERKDFFETCTALLLPYIDFFIFFVVFSHPKVLNFINLSSTGLCIGC